MKMSTKLFLLMTMMASTAMSSPSTSMAPKEKEVVVGINDAYIPGGFDSSSDVYVVVNGIFPNSCYKWSRADVSEAGQNVTDIKSIARVSQGMCLMVLVPFNREVRLGKMAPGEHKLRFVSGDGTYLEKTLVVER